MSLLMKEGRPDDRFSWRNSCSEGNEAPASLTLRERSSSVTLCSAVERNYHYSVERNRELIPPDTDMFRVMDGAGDGIPGVFVDQMADRILVSTRGCSIPADLESELRDTGLPVFHKKLEQNQKEAPVQIAGPLLPLQFTALEQGVRFKIDMSAGYSQGIFLDQRDHRRRVREKSAPGMRVLNTFAYTGAFSVYAALGGAQTTTLDLAQPCLDWARENFVLNGIDPSGQYFCKGDARRWLERFARQGRTFHGIILDPPTFSRDDRGKVFRVESHYGELVALARECLEPGGWMLCTSNCRKLSHEEFRRMVARAVPGFRLTHDPMPPDFSGEDYLKRLWVDWK